MNRHIDRTGHDEVFRTQHRRRVAPADRVARQTNVGVISVSESMQIVSLYYGTAESSHKGAQPN